MLSLRCIREHFKDKDNLPEALRATATADLVCVIFLNGFARRCAEWEALTVDHFNAQIDKGLENIVWATHKTGHINGVLAKVAGSWNDVSDSVLH